MSKDYCFKEEEKQKIIKRFGEEFYKKVLKDINIYEVKWGLDSFEFIPSYSANLVFKCYSQEFGNAVLKIGNSKSKEFINEAKTLKEYKGRGFSRIFKADLKNGIILQELIEPGNTLREETSLDNRLEVFSKLYKNLHIEVDDSVGYPSYLDWVCRITDYMSSREDCKELYVHMKKARDICIEISDVYSRKMLLHGDFHHDNILLSESGEYKIIDPKGIVADPVFDIPRFILNEFEDEITVELFEKINRVICVLGEKLDIPNEIIKKSLYVEVCMGMSWCVEDGASVDEYKHLMEIVCFAERIMNS